MTDPAAIDAGRKRDEEHLRLLSIFHFIVAALTALFALFPVLHLVVGGMILTGGLDVPNEEAEVATLVGALFVVIALVFIGAGFALAAAMAAAGVFLRRRERYTFCLVVASVSCLLMPFGTVLGVFTIVVLVRDSVKALFEQAA